MKNSRYKKAAKRMLFFVKNFGFHAPYNLLIDGTFCMQALQNKVNISEQLPKYLQAEIKILTTQCCILEIEQITKFSEALKGAWLILKQFPTHRCGHEGKPVKSAECIKSMIKINNSQRYILASMDNDLKSEVRSICNSVPMIYLHRSAPTLEKPVDKVVEKVNETLQRTITDKELEKLDAMKLALGMNKVAKKKKVRKRLTGAEIRRRRKAKREMVAEVSRQNQPQQAQEQTEEKKEISKKAKKSSDYSNMTILEHINSVFGVQ